MPETLDPDTNEVDLAAPYLGAPEPSESVQAINFSDVHPSEWKSSARRASRAGRTPNDPDMGDTPHHIRFVMDHAEIQ